jgi:cell division septation protein DedD
MERLITVLETRLEVREPVQTQPSAPPVYHIHPQIVQQPAPVPVTQPRVIPGIPDPNNGRIYRLQVGAFSSPETATIIARQVGSAGFNVVMELSGSMYRVLATDVPAFMVSSAIQRLGVIGINQVWIRE